MNYHIGQKVGDLTLLEIVWKMDNSRKRKYWKAKCRCGNICIVREDNFRDKRNSHPSCGCRRKWFRHLYYLRGKQNG